MDHLHALIMAGGSGTRFWPASRKDRPKQLLPIAPGSDRSLLENTILRVLPLCAEERIVVVTGERLLEATRAALRPFPKVKVVAEPVARNTAPCIGWGTALVARQDPRAIVMALPADHHIADEDGFRRALELAARSAENGPVTTIGITPSRPETGYGHIEASDEVAPGVRRALRFVEKPTRERAEEYMRSGRYVWNSGMFFYRASAMLEAIAAHLPDLSTGLARIESAATRGPSAEEEETRAASSSTDRARGSARHR
jgi:mannose-1-phosphate guanylyltransferase